MPADSGVTRSRRTLISTGYVAIVGTFVAVCVLPYWHSSVKVHAEIAASQRQIAARIDAKKQLEEVAKQVKFISLEVGNHDRLLPALQDLGPFMEQLSHELDNAGMKEITVRALPPITLGKSQQLPIEVGGTCTFSQFHQFLVHLECLPRMSSVSHLSVESSETAMTGKVSVQLTLSIYNAKPAS